MLRWRIYDHYLLIAQDFRVLILVTSTLVIEPFLVRTFLGASQRNQKVEENVRFEEFCGISSE